MPTCYEGKGVPIGLNVTTISKISGAKNMPFQRKENKGTISGLQKVKKSGVALQ